MISVNLLQADAARSNAYIHDSVGALHRKAWPPGQVGDARIIWVMYCKNPKLMCAGHHSGAALAKLGREPFKILDLSGIEAPSPRCDTGNAVKDDLTLGQDRCSTKSYRDCHLVSPPSTGSNCAINDCFTPNTASEVR